MNGQSQRPRAYLDHNATAPLRPEARAAALSAFASPANPSSVHAEGRRARAILEEARALVADLVGAAPTGVVFTSGATEAAHLALSPDLVSGGRAGFDRLLVAATDHAAVLKNHRFPGSAVTVLPVLPDGTLDLAVLDDALAHDGRPVVAVQVANNETGVIQPVAAIAARVHAVGGLLVCDAVQAAGRIPCDGLDADILLLSGHKLGGLAGAGALVIKGAGVALGSAVQRGGGQERGWRAGTENVAALASFGAAALAATSPASDLATLRDEFERALLAMAPDAVVFGVAAPRLPNTSAFAVPGVAAERLLIALDLNGVAVSSGSACASGVVGRSHVLDAMNVEPDLRRGALRVSFGWDSTEAHGRWLAEVLAMALQRMRRGRAAGSVTVAAMRRGGDQEAACGDKEAAGAGPDAVIVVGAVRTAA